nr:MULTISPECIES: hypothetical protein [unclassified Mesorhizobium]
MISATVLAVFFVPVFYVFVMDPLGRRRKGEKLKDEAVPAPAE